MIARTEDRTMSNFEPRSPGTAPKSQMTKLDPTPPMSMAQKLLLQQVTGKFLYYARGIDDTMMHSLNDLATQTNNGTQMTAVAITYFLNCCASNPDAITLYRASDMILTKSIQMQHTL